MMIKDILTHHGDWKESDDYNMLQKPAFFELSAIQNAISDYIEEYKYRCVDNYMECIRRIKPSIGIYNIYGRIMHKKANGCSHFYKMLSTHDRKDGWDGPCNKMEIDLTNFDPDYEFDRENFFNNVNKIMSIIYFNRIKQFMIRLYRNNLFFGTQIW